LRERSAAFGPFVPVGYPTAAQKRAGFTGDGIGIHAPHRVDRDKGAFNTGGNWTAGCLSVGSDAEAEEIVQFVHQRRPRSVSLESRRYSP
jgi:murein L,D-transpeptidase YafK